MQNFIKRYRAAIFLVVMLLGLIGCATQPVPDAFEPPGFWIGIVHGFVIFFSIIGSIFLDVRIYAFPNSGGFYDFGYFLGVMMFLSSGSEPANRCR